MDATAQLALMSKAQLVFGTPDHFLSFPVLTPFSFKPADLDFGSALSNPGATAALESFSRAVGCCPADPVFSADGGEMLWDRYDAWLNAMSLAGSVLSAADQAAYVAAQSLLFVTDATTGLRSDSPVLVAYKQCRDVAIDAEQAYTAAKLTATAAGTVAPDGSWVTTDEPMLRAAIVAADANWADIGRRADVEAAQATILRIQAQMPQAMWTGWRQDYVPALDQITNPASGASFAPAGFTPSDVSGLDWTTLTLSEAEFDGLTAQAPKALQDVLGGQGASQVQSISFEFRSVAVVRSWFDPSVFGARFWSFPDGTVLSDGATPPVGTWPAYVSAVVLVRNVVVTPKPGVPPPPPVHGLPILPPTIWRRPVLPVRTLPMQPIHVGPGPGLHPMPMMAMARPMMAAPMMAAPVAIAPRPPMVLAGRPVMPPPRVGPVVPPLQRLAVASYVFHPVVAPTPAPAPTPTPAPAPAVDDTISILAFLCTRLPKTPDPDPTLSW